MKIAIIVGGFILIFGLGFLALTTQANPSDDNGITIEQVNNEVSESTALLLDVRTSEEYAQGHFEGAELLSLQAIERGELPDTSKDTILYVYCRSGSRSSQAARLLKDAGYQKVVDLGGLADVEKLGGTLVH